MKRSISNWQNSWARLGRTSSTKGSRRIAKRSLKFESLEPRQMLAADISLGSDASYDEDEPFGENDTITADYATVSESDTAGDNLDPESGPPSYSSAGETVQPIDDSLIDELMADDQFASEMTDYLSDSSDDSENAAETDQVASYDESDSSDGSDAADLTQAEDDSVPSGPWEIPEDLTGPTTPQSPFFDSQEYAKHIREDAEPGVLLSVSAEDPQNDKVRYSIDRTEYTNPDTGWVSRVVSDLFSIDAETGQISLNESVDYEKISQYHLVLLASDQDGNTGSSWVDVYVQDIDESPRFDSRSYAVGVAENTPGPITSVAASDPQSDPTNPFAHPLTYSLTDDVDGRFRIDKTTGEISLASPLDYESNASYQLQVTVSDPDGYSDAASVHVTVLDVDEAPVVTSADAATFRENTTDDQLSLAADDPENEGVTFTISGGDDGHRFQLDYGALKLADAVDFENPSDANGDNVYEVEVEAKDEGGNTATQTIRVTVADANDAPTFAKDEFVFVTSKRILEDGLRLGPDAISVEDADGDSLSLTLSGEALSINSDGELRIKASELVKDAFTSNYMYRATVTVSDGELSDTAEILVYDDHEPYLQDIENHINSWEISRQSLVTDTFLNASEAVDALDDEIGSKMAVFEGAFGDVASITWDVVTKDTLPGKITKIIARALATHVEKGHHEVVAEIHELMKQIRQRDRDRITQIAMNERDALSSLLSDIGDDPQQVKTEKVVTHLKRIKLTRQIVNSPPAEVNEIYGGLLYSFARAKNWRIKGGQWNVDHGFPWWSTAEINSPLWYTSHDLVDELNTIGYRR